MEVLEIGIAQPVTFKAYVKADGRQKPGQRLGRGVLARKPYPPCMAHQIVIREVTADLQQPDAGAVAAQVVDQIDMRRIDA